MGSDTILLLLLRIPVLYSNILKTDIHLCLLSRHGQIARKRQKE